MMYQHIINQLSARNIPIPIPLLVELASMCKKDTALILLHLPKRIKVEKSEGDKVILIIRRGFPVTIMYRRNNQPLCPLALKVENVYDVSCTVQNIIKGD